MVANGSTFEQKETSPRRLTPTPSFLFWNAQGSFFYDLAPWNRSFSQPHVSRGLAVADFNNDGAMDVAIVDQGEGVRRHSRISTTMDIYAQFVPEGQKQAIRQLRAFVERSVPNVPLAFH